MNIKKKLELFYAPVLFVLNKSHHRLKNKIAKATYAHLKRSTVKSGWDHQYPYKIHPPVSIFGKSQRYDKFILVGDSWNDKNKPIALMIGFNDWKYGFIADYFEQYRTAFAKRKLSNFSFFNIFLLMPAPKVIIVWGYNENYLIRLYARIFRKKIYRVEDGFIRSANLGASHSTPYSLVFEKKNLYYNARKKSTVIDILNAVNYSKEEYDRALTALNVLKKLKISKYNDYKRDEFEFDIKSKKRVAVIGQVASDASLRYGNPDKWTMYQLVKLAYFENIDAEILYRPHPEVYKGYQKNKSLKNIEKLATISHPSIPYIDFLENVDKVYVINSLSGLEALLWGKEVVTVGAPFYSGWGLTDDRCTKSKKYRKRKLSFMDLFIGVYIRYPLYLANPFNPFDGIIASCYKIHADMLCSAFSNYKALENNKSYDSLIKTDFWTNALLNHSKYISPVEIRQLINSHKLKNIFRSTNSLQYEKVVSCFIIGTLPSVNEIDLFLKSIRELVLLDTLDYLLLELNKYHPGDYLYQHILWLYNQKESYKDAVFLSKEYMSSFDSKVSNISNSSNQNDHQDQCQDDEIFIGYNDIDAKALVEGLNSAIYDMNYDYANSILCRLFITSQATTTLLVKAIEVLQLQFDFKSAQHLSNILQNTDLLAHNKASLNLYMESFDFADTQCSREQIILSFAKQVSLNPDRINRTWPRLKNYIKDNKVYDLMLLISNLYHKNDFHRSSYFLEINQLNKAYNILNNMIDQGLHHTSKFSTEYSKVIFTMGDHAKAEYIIAKCVEKEPSHEAYTEYLRQLKARGLFKKALSIAREAIEKKVNLTIEGHIMPIYFGLGEIEQGFKCFHDTAKKKALIRAFGDSKYRHENTLCGATDLLLIFNSGPAEEIRYACIYQNILDELGVGNFKITCDHRLEKLLSRSFPDICFVPTKRVRFISEGFPLSEYNKLPSLELITDIDNSTLQYIESSNQIKILTELIFNYKKSYKDFEYAKPYLKVDEQLVEHYRSLLPKNKIMIGISWRSFLCNAMRNIHYLSVDDMKPIFDIPNVTFVNLQYDECTHELAEIKQKYNVDVIDFEDLNQMDDFDGVAALMKNLDLVISPFTAVIELAGSIGVPGFLFSNHGESFWRKYNNNNRDVWYESVKVVGSGSVGDKQALVYAIKDEIINALGIK
ncbi:capsular polysaccharide export protein, LipB/KpsS family [Francisella sciaenopsi]|uniref:Capsule biosynthesis protein n=1 Tax=Francisella sciaenopsi TaxID=3055034 RepID=A0ABQ6PKE2_9GAMM